MMTRETAIKTVQMGVASDPNECRKIAFGIYADLCDRGVIKHEIAKIEPEVRDSMIEDWQTIISVVLSGEV